MDVPVPGNVSICHTRHAGEKTSPFYCLATSWRRQHGWAVLTSMVNCEITFVRLVLENLLKFK
jgi:hypothetical protein